MFRHGLRRCAQQASNVAASSMLRSRAALPIARQSLASATRSSVPLNSLPAFVRSYSAESAAQVTEAQADPNAVYFKDLTTQGVHPNLLQAITTDFGYATMSPVQAKTIAPALKGTDIVAQAKTGTGKTIAFLLPLLQRMINDDPTLADPGARRSASSDDIRGIVLSPTRELAEQIAVEARALTRRTGIQIQTAVGGTNKNQALRQMQRQGCHLLIGTPGRLNDLLHDHRAGVAAPNLASLVLDEADRMLDVGFERELNEIISALPKPEEKIRQTLLVSATIPDNVIRLARSMVRQDDFEFVQTIAADDTLTHDRIPQHMVPVASWANIYPTLLELINRESAKAKELGTSPFKAIIYLNTSAAVELSAQIAFAIKRAGQFPLNIQHIMGKRSQEQRNRAADAFRKATSGILISSDVTARGMDFPNVTHVIQIDTPRDRETYIHRLGRTGRADKAGEGWILLPPNSVGPARRLLQGLPIQKNESLESCSSESTPAAEIVKAAYPDVNTEVRDETYSTLISASTHNKIQLVDELNDWFTNSWGMDKPPSVSPHWAAKQNLSAANLNFERKQRTFTEAEGGNRMYGRRGDDHRAARRESSDPFDAMRSNIRRDDYNSGGRGGGRSGGFGRGRGGGFGGNRGGFGRDRDQGSSW